MAGWTQRKEESFLQHPLTRLVAGFLLTTVAGTYLTTQWKAKDWRNQQRFLYEQERLKEAYEVLDNAVEAVGNTLTAADDLVTVAVWDWDPKERKTELAERIQFWRKESREWRSRSRVVLSKLRIHFGEDAAESFKKIIKKRRQLGVGMRALLEKLQVDRWENHREAIEKEGRDLNSKINEVDEELSALTSVLHEALSERSLLPEEAGSETAQADAGDSQVRHIVLCWLKEPGSETARRKLIEATEALGDLPGVVDVAVGVPLASDRPVVDDSFDVGIVFTFEDAEALAAYQDHPRHLKAVEEVLQPLVERILVYDVRPMQ